MAKAASPARAWLGTIVFLFLEPGVVAGFIPWLISGWRLYGWGGAAWVLVPTAWIAIAAGAAFLLHAFALFARHRGTPAPIAPTETLVVTGVYRFVRNPMYLAVLTIILGNQLAPRRSGPVRPEPRAAHVGGTGAEACTKLVIPAPA